MNSDITDFWNNYIFTSIHSEQKSSKNKPNYQHYIENNNTLSTFQVDLLTFIEKNEKNKEHFYVLVCIDEVSKYAFCTFLKRKLSKNVKQAFVSLIQKIRKMQNKKALYAINENLTFYGDFGEEFMFKEVKKYCETQNAKIINIGMATVTKLGMVERLIRTLQEMLSVTIKDITTKEEYKNEVKTVVNIYNNQNHSFLKMSPNKYLSSNMFTQKTWDVSSNKNKKFNYFTNKTKIKNKLQMTKKHFPVMQPVRLFKKVKKQYKRSHFSTWSNQIYFVDGYKIPLHNESDIGIYLSNHDGKRITGITYSQQLKKVIMPDYLQIKNIITFIKKKKSIRCSFDNFPDSFYKDILISDLNKYSIPKSLRLKIKKWREKHDI